MIYSEFRKFSILLIELITEYSYVVALGNCWAVTSKITDIIIEVNNLAGDIYPYIKIHVRIIDVRIAGVVR